MRTQSKSSVKDNVGLLFGSSVGRELLSVSCENKELGFKMEGQITNANYSVKKLQFLLFINRERKLCQTYVELGQTVSYLLCRQTRG